MIVSPRVVSFLVSLFFIPSILVNMFSFFQRNRERLLHANVSLLKIADDTKVIQKDIGSAQRVIGYTLFSIGLKYYKRDTFDKALACSEEQSIKKILVHKSISQDATLLIEVYL
ncbi:hypothetical protein K501DRAFT_276174 [Backusella circina FSU 941]|nr:hypothetical protein K501DRAFT_276174 [Backusella circina FSU 941]